MSKFLPTKPNTRYQKIQWMNTLVHVHDLQCECDKPLEHTAYTIFTEEKNLRFSPEEKKAFETCLTTPGEPTKEEDDPFGDGELEALFAEDPTDTGKDKDTTDTATKPR